MTFFENLLRLQTMQVEIAIHTSRIEKIKILKLLYRIDLFRRNRQNK